MATMAETLTANLREAYQSEDEQAWLSALIALYESAEGGIYADRDLNIPWLVGPVTVVPCRDGSIAIVGDRHRNELELAVRALTSKWDKEMQAFACYLARHHQRPFRVAMVNKLAEDAETRRESLLREAQYWRPGGPYPMRLYEAAGELGKAVESLKAAAVALEAAEIAHSEVTGDKPVVHREPPRD